MSQWVLPVANPVLQATLSRALGVDPLTARVLVSRGCSSVAAAGALLAEGFVTIPRPSDIPGMDAAAERLAHAVVAGERVCLFGDYDVDGVTATCLLWQFLAAVGLPCRVRLPTRAEGYGLSTTAVEAMAAGGAQVVLTADCGVNAHDAVRRAHELGLTVVVTDHHRPDGAGVAPAAAVANPLLDATAAAAFPVAGVGVAWLLAAAVRRRLRALGHFRQRPEPNLRRLLGLVALGTVADVVPLIGINRAFVQEGLVQLNRERPPGLLALSLLAGVAGSLRAEDLGFRLGPRLNAAGRMATPLPAFELLSAADNERAADLAVQLDVLNERRREAEHRVLEAARAQIARQGWEERQSLVVDGPWHPGVLGLVASRLAERFSRPAVVLHTAGETTKGSARAPAGWDLWQLLEACRPTLLRFGGHRAAAGLALETRRLEEFRGRFEEAVAARETGPPTTDELRLDGALELAEVTLGAVAGLRRLEPFGAGNAEPLFLLPGLRIDATRPIGTGGEHRKLVLSRGDYRLDAVAWRVPGSWPGDEAGSRVDVAALLQVDEWRRGRRVQLVVQALRQSA